MKAHVWRPPLLPYLQDLGMLKSIRKLAQEICFHDLGALVHTCAY